MFMKRRVKQKVNILIFREREGKEVNSHKMEQRILINTIRCTRFSIIVSMWSWELSKKLCGFICRNAIDLSAILLQ
jgi:hypothetical protein